MLTHVGTRVASASRESAARTRAALPITWRPWPRCTTRPRSTSRRSSRSKRRASSRCGPGSSNGSDCRPRPSPRPSDRLVDRGYVELAGDRRLQPHRPRAGASRPRSCAATASPSACSSTSSGSSGRRCTPKPPLGARDLGRRRGEARAAARRPGHVPARQPDPGVRNQVDTTRTSPRRRRARARRRRAASARSWSSTRTRSALLATSDLIPGRARVVVGGPPTACRARPTTGAHTVPERLAHAHVGDHGRGLTPCTGSPAQAA